MQAGLFFPQLSKGTRKQRGPESCMSCGKNNASQRNGKARRLVICLRAIEQVASFPLAAQPVNHRPILPLPCDSNPDSSAQPIDNASSSLNFVRVNFQPNGP